MTSVSAKCGQVKRRLKANEPLKGEVLEFALSVIGGGTDDLLDGIARKLRAGQQLTEYEYHVFVEVILLHVRLAARARAREEQEDKPSGSL